MEMKGIGESHAAHIGRVEVTFSISSADLDPDVVSTLLGMRGDYSARAGDPRRAKNGVALSPHKEGLWKIKSGALIRVSGRALKDVNEHFRALLQILLPHRDELAKLAVAGDSFFDVLWESSYLYAGTGPLLESESIRGIADLAAGVGFDIYQIEESSAGEAG